jgi:hypothetical protein
VDTFNLGYLDSNGNALSPQSEGTAGYPARITVRERPSLERAWGYFEHVALPRYVVKQKPDAPRKNILYRFIRKCFCKANKQLDKAEPGENHLPTYLYSPIFTPLKQMGDFGLGIGLYFSTLRAITVLTLFAGLINIVNFQYFNSYTYSDGQPGIEPVTLLGSAICTRQVWVPCPDCNVTNWTNDVDKIATATTINVFGQVETLTFALRNDCEGATLQQGMVNYGTLMFVLVGILVMNVYQKHMEIKYDEDEQTAQDYSVVIRNPPHDANNPEEWRAFFHDNFDGAHTTTCTIAVDNDLLVRSLQERRECMRKIEMLVEPGTSLEDLNLAQIAAGIERQRGPFGRFMALVLPGIPELFGRATVLTAKIQGLAQQEYPVSNVFISFETEAAQRHVLAALSVGDFAANHNNVRVHKNNPNYLFRGNVVLRVEEPDEPSTVRWEDLNVKLLARIKQIFYTTLATLVAIFAIAFLIWVINGINVAWAALAIAVANGVFPIFAKILVLGESHASEGGLQTSLYFKIAIFRWANTAIIITIITPFTKTLDRDEGLIPAIWAIFFAEIVTTNAIQFLDPVGHLQRHFLAPRAATQDAMNLNMQGQVVELAERYTNMTKILFLALWYCSIYPCTLFLCSFALLVNFFTDRFSLMRTWKRAPMLGNTISSFSRKYFFSAAIVAMAIASSYYWSGFPFDNLCSDATGTLDPSYYDVDNITTVGSKTTYNVTLAPGDNDTPYKYCLQDLLRTPGRNFPALPQFQPEGGEWMTEDQEQITTLYGWTSLGVLGIVALTFIWGWYQSARGLFRGTYESRGEDQKINFSDVPSISTYVPQVASNVYAYPLFACRIEGIPEELFDWKDPDHPFSFYDLTIDAEELLRGMNMEGKTVFSTLNWWPPPDEKQKNGASNDNTNTEDRTE